LQPLDRFGYQYENKFRISEIKLNFGPVAQLDTCLPAGRERKTNKMYFVYVLQSEKDGRLYKGFTEDLKRRIKEHNNGKNKSTKGYIPWKLIYFEEVKSRLEAREREKFFKSGSGREYLKNIMDP
jgi:putative endonuclease